MTGILHIVLARKPIQGTVSDNCLAYGTGALNVDACRVETTESLNGGAYSGERREKTTEWQNADRSSGQGSGFRLGVGTYVQPIGRFPANLVLASLETISSLFPITESVGHTPKTRGTGGLGTSGHSGQNGIIERHHDSGSASRFFFSFSEQESDE